MSSEGPKPGNLPATIDRGAVERVLARALELQAGSAGDTADRLTEAQLLDLAKEVGLDAVHLRQALAEERTRVAVPEERGVLAALYGGASVSAQRTIAGTPAQVLKALDDWMQRQECLTVKRHFGERIVWEADRGVASAVKRAVSGKGDALARANDVAATAIALDASRVVVRLDAHLGSHRASMAQVSAGLGVTSLLAGGVLAALTFPVWAAVAPAAVLVPAVWGLTRSSHTRTVERAQLALEQVLDRLERGDAGRPPTLLSMLAAAVRR
ncbi:MAG TPA: hypothetical protein VGP25_09755 [Gemmatimonadaceae bacterium]|jgi:hypothetical protein|nr:hypothetical protein [Gemmatimonadaceae bacterium]